MQHLDAVVLVEGLDHGRRRGRAADHRVLHGRELELVGLHVLQQRQPHRRHARGEGNLLLLEQLVEAGAVERHAGEDDLGADHRRRVGQAPGVDVEHRHHRQHDRARRQAKRIGQRRAIGVQHGRAVRVEHALRIAGRARGVAERRCGLLVEVGPLQGAGLACDQLLVAQQVGDLARGRHVGAVGHHHDMLHGLELADHALDDRQQVEVDKDDLVFGVVGDVGHMLGREARVQGVQHGAEAGDAEIELEMAVGVPGNGADPVAELDAQALQRLGQLLGAPGGVLVAVAMDRALDRARDDLDIGVVARREIDHLGDQQRAVLHQAKHGVPSFVLCAPLQMQAPKRREFPEVRF